MIPGAALADWLSDVEAQRRSYDKVEAFGAKWADQRLMTELKRELAQLAFRTPEALLAAARRFMDRVEEIGVMFRELIAISCSDPFFRPPFHPLSSEVQSSLLLFHHPDLSIALGVSSVDALAAKKTGRTGNASINFTGVVTMMRFVKSGNAELSFWETDPITDRFVASEAAPCRLVDRRRIADGEEIVVDGRRHSFVVEHAESDIVYFQAEARAAAAPLALEYDCDSRGLVGASGTDEASSRIQMMASLLRALDRDDACALLDEAATGQPFFARWHVMREMLALDAEAALPSLRRMAAEDPHPDIRDAARQSLQLFFEGEMDGPVEEGAACRA